MIISIFISLMYLFFPLKIINPELQPYYNHFMMTAKAYCDERDLNQPDRIEIDFSSTMDRNILGYCMRYGDLSYFLKIQKQFWDRATDAEKYQLVIHELTHCVMREGHSDDRKHYMYYAMNSLTIEETSKQLNDFLLQKCSNGVYDTRKLFNFSLPSRQLPGLL
jgi:hypothetical protein